MSDEQGIAALERDAFIAGWLAAMGDEAPWFVDDEDDERASALLAWERHIHETRAHG